MPKKNAVNAPQIVESSNAYNHPVRATSRAGSGKAANYGHIPDKTQSANFKGHIAPTGTITLPASQVAPEVTKRPITGISCGGAGRNQATTLDAFALWLHCGKIVPFSDWLEAYNRQAAREAWGTQPRPAPSPLPELPGGVFFRR